MSLSGQTIVATAGAAVPLGDQPIQSSLMVKALDANTGIVALGNDGNGDVTLDNGLRLAAGEAVIFEFVGHLANLMLDSAVNGEGVAWIRLNV